MLLLLLIQYCYWKTKGKCDAYTFGGFLLSVKDIIEATKWIFAGTMVNCVANTHTACSFAFLGYFLLALMTNVLVVKQPLDDTLSVRPITRL